MSSIDPAAPPAPNTTSVNNKKLPGAFSGLLGFMSMNNKPQTAGSRKRRNKKRKVSRKRVGRYRR